MSPPIRLLMTISDLSGGGAERQFSLLARHLSRHRFELHLCFWRPVFDYEFPEDAAVHMIEKTRSWHVVRAIRQMRRLIEELRPEVIYSQLHYVNMVTGTALARCRHRPRWVCRQVNDPQREMRGPFAVWARRALSRADRVVGCSQGVRQATIEHLRLDPERVVRIDNLADVPRIEQLAVEPPAIEKSPEVFTVVHAGRLCEQKNQAMLLSAFSHLRHQPAELWILGEGPLEDRLRATAEGLGIADRVRWLGFQSNPYPFYRAADCCALTSDFEGLPNVVIEAMICGTPAVATRCRFGPEELIAENVDGLLVPVGDAQAFGAALSHLAQHRDELRRLGEAARRKARARFGTRPIGAAYAELFEQLVVAGRSAGRR